MLRLNTVEIGDLVVLEQFVTQLPEGTVEWVQCYCPVKIEDSVQLVEDHLVEYPRAGSTSLSSCSSISSHTGQTPRECRRKAWPGVLRGVQAFL